ncbi:hypothetical protein GCG54_00004389 [Colletotrichum gloeosporioides]|uniref:Uncharacterized protein n=1 Tax=Colletotrichum gloeosporioides TaxID=474922 RepID=A0A8H4CLB1_COLGL|nr:uncharacterized protein GCG54_00004389 [Colletotrichum gloeosporioides]KAF3806063.1 hypothetical protein GCG54_00004389 [Colletotrichum gloeosporioides]
MTKHSIQQRANAEGSFGRLAQAVQFIAHVSIILCALGLSSKLDWPPSIGTAINSQVADITSHVRPASKPIDQRPATIPLATVELEYSFVQDLSKSLCKDPKFPGEHLSRYRTNETPQDAMNLHYVYKRLGNNITRANDGDKIENHGYKIHVAHGMDTLTTHLGQFGELSSELSSKLSSNTSSVTVTVPPVAVATTITTKDESIPIVPHPYLPLKQSTRRWPVASKTYTDKETRTMTVMNVMNLEDMCKRGPDVIEKAQGDWEVYDHYFKVHMWPKNWGDNPSHLAKVFGVVPRNPASGVVTDPGPLMLGDYYKGSFDDDTIVAISKMEKVKKIEHMRKLAGTDEQYDVHPFR